MLLIYRFLTILFFPIFIFLIYIRKFLGKEDKIRFKEKIFSSSFRPNKRNKNNKLIWFHGASIGEITSVIPLIESFKKNNRNISILITTVTLSSGKIVEKRFGNDKDIHHRYFPIDVPSLTEKFIDLWKPNLAIFIDSEIWPNFIFNIKKNNIPLALINGRITKKTFDRWMLLGNFSRKVFASFDLCLPSSKESETNLKNLNTKNVKFLGNLKFMNSKNKIQKLNSSITQFLNIKKVWCAASTHNQEEIFCLKAHLEIKKTHNNILTILIPRHIKRVNNILTQCNQLNLNSQILNPDEKIKENSEVLIINSYGVLQQYYNYCKSVFIGKSLIKKLHLVGGQNPLEAALEGCKIYHGPYVYNFEEIYNFLKINGISQEINDVHTLSSNITKDLYEDKKIDNTSIEKINAYGDNILNKTVLEINELITK